ncbi:MAG: winged helix-turn-helix domain-containing protein, partial [Parvibaculaceae bacterium]
MESASRTAFSINGVLADLNSESLRGPDGGTVRVRPQAFATLRYLLQNPNRLVTKAELMHAVWRGTSVTDDSLVQCVHELRRALKDERHAILQTVSRRGYRIVLPEKNFPMAANRASLAVLPFTNLNRDSERDYFVDGLTEDLITNLARIPGLFVIARNSSFSYR